MISLPSAVVADANVVLSAVFGRRARDVLVSAVAPRCHAPISVGSEVARHLPALAARRKLDLDLAFGALRAVPITWHDEPDYSDHREEALRRIGARDPDDWPVVALALALGLPIWTQDKDFEEAGLATYTTGQILDLVRALSGD